MSLGEKPRFKILHDFRVFLSYIGRFAGVGDQVKKFSLARQKRDFHQLPVAFADRAAKTFNVIDRSLPAARTANEADR
jgi:hypothetical protein